MGGSRGREGEVEEIGLVRRTIQDVLVPEMQAIKERLAGQDEKFVSIEKRFGQVDKRFEQIDRRFEAIEKRLDAVEKTMTEGFSALRAGLEQLRAAIDRIEARLSFNELDRRILRLEVLQDHAHPGPKSSAA
jgi:chromosome segregation ATPase